MKNWKEGQLSINIDHLLEVDDILEIWFNNKYNIDNNRLHTS